MILNDILVLFFIFKCLVYEFKMFLIFFVVIVKVFKLRECEEKDKKRGRKENKK